MATTTGDNKPSSAKAAVKRMVEGEGSDYDPNAEFRDAWTGAGRGPIPPEADGGWPISVPPVRVTRV